MRFQQPTEAAPPAPKRAAPAASPRLGARQAQVLWLQRQIGNQRTTALLGRRPAEPPRSGLAAPAETTEFASQAVAYVRHSPDATPAQLVDFLAGLANQSLARAKVPPLTGHRIATIAEGTTGALFQVWEWNMIVDMGKVVDPPVTRVADVPAAQAAQLADSVYHESRHAEQAFRVAAFMARSEHKDAVAIAAETRMPLTFAALAVSSWGDAAAPADAASVAATAGWRAFRGAGRHTDYRDWVLALQDDLERQFATPPRMKNVQADPALRPQLEQWEQQLLERKFPAWRKHLRFVETKDATLEKTGPNAQTDAIVRQQLGHIIGDMTNLFQAGRNLRKLRDGHAPAADVDIAEEELQDKLLDAFLSVAGAYEAFPGETDAAAAGDAVATAYGLDVLAAGAQSGATAGAPRR